MKMAKVWAVALAMLLVLPVASLARAEGPETIGDIEPVTGTTERLGGGDYVAVKLRDAWFAVVYGTEANPNAITMVSETNRYVGGATVTRPDGSIVDDKPVMVRTMLAHQLRYALEYRDVNGDAMADTGGDNATSREAVKALSLKMGWATSGVQEVESSEGREWKFSLTAENISYTYVWDGTGAEKARRNATSVDGALERMEFTFHIRVTERIYENVSVPWFNVSLERQMGQLRIGEVERAPNRTMSGTAFDCGIKYDHLIEGWDFADANSRLAVGVAGIMGTHVNELANDWMRERFQERFMQRYNWGGSADFGGYTTSGNWSGGKRLMTRDRIEFDDDWQRVGRFAWESGIHVRNQGVEQNLTVKFQVFNGERVRHDGFETGEFNGFGFHGAYLYPQGERIYHDPGLEATALFLGSLPSALLPTGLIVLQVAVGVAAVAAVVVYKVTRPKKK